MSNSKLTQSEAERLLTMLKRSLEEQIHFPQKGQSKEFDVIGDIASDQFTVCIFRGKINEYKYNLGARIKKNGILLLELHINPSSVHWNPDGKKISGSHWHVYTEEHDRLMAFEANDILAEDFISNTLMFLTEFNVIELPAINYQPELF